MLNSFQLRSARSVIGIGLREVASYLGVSREIISKWENQLAFQKIRTQKASIDTLEFFFSQYNIIFPDEYTISLKDFDIQKASPGPEDFTRFQLRASRAALNLTQEQLANYMELKRPDISYLEQNQNDFFLINNKRSIDYRPLKYFFEQHAIIFNHNFSVTLDRSSFKDLMP